MVSHYNPTSPPQKKKFALLIVSQNKTLDDMSTGLQNHYSKKDSPPGMGICEI